MRFHHECWLTLQTTSETLVDAVLVFWVIVYSLPETVVAQTYSQTQTPLLSIRLTNILLNKFIFAWMTNLSIIPKKTWVDGLLNDWMREWMHECVGEWARGNKWFYINVVLFCRLQLLSDPCSPLSMSGSDSEVSASLMQTTITTAIPATLLRPQPLRITGVPHWLKSSRQDRPITRQDGGMVLPPKGTIRLFSK